MKISSGVDFHLSNTQAWVKNSTLPQKAVSNIFFYYQIWINTGICSEIGTINNSIIIIHENKPILLWKNRIGK